LQGDLFVRVLDRTILTSAAKLLPWIAVSLCALPANASVSAALVGNSAHIQTFLIDQTFTASSIQYSQGSSVYHGGTIEALSSLTPADINFKNGAAVVGYASQVTVTTGVAITFKNDQSFAVQPVLQSTLLAAGIGVFVTDQLLDPSDPSITGASCVSSQIVNCGEVTRTLNSGLDTIGAFGFMTAGFDFDVSVGGTSVYGLAGDIASDVSGFTANFNGADTILNGFGLTSSPGSLWAHSYAWQDTTVDIVIPGLLQPGDSITAVYTITTSANLKGSCSQQSLVSGDAVTVCPIAFSSFGDPIRSGGVINNSSQRAFDAYLTSGGLINGLTTAAIGRFSLPTEYIDPVTHQMTAKLPGVTIFPDDGGGPAVPEPASWALMIAGFGMVGGALRRGAGLRS
jgi:hypothetical protein